MKRRPVNIIMDLIEVLNGLNIGEKYSYNQLKKSTLMHYDTIKDYITLIGLVQTFAPKINISIKKNDVSIRDYSLYISTLPFKEKIILVLFLKKAFLKDSAIKIKDLFLSINHNYELNEEQMNFNKSLNLLSRENYLTIHNLERTKKYF